MIKKTNGKCISMFGSHPILNHLINSWIKPLKSSWNSRILNTSSKHFRSSIKYFVNISSVKTKWVLGKILGNIFGWHFEYVSGNRRNFISLPKSSPDKNHVLIVSENFQKISNFEKILILWRRARKSMHEKSPTLFCSDSKSDNFVRYDSQLQKRRKSKTIINCHRNWSFYIQDIIEVIYYFYLF